MEEESTMNTFKFTVLPSGKRSFTITVGLVVSLMLSALSPTMVAAQNIKAKRVNPIVLPSTGGANTADPTARVFGKKLYVYTSTDSKTLCHKGPYEDYVGYCMPGYQIFSTANMRKWTKHGTALMVDKPWQRPTWVAKKTARMWAPEVIQNGSKYYMFFPAPQKDILDMRIGVAVANKPEGPFIARPVPIDGSLGGAIDPSVIKLGSKWYMFTNYQGSMDIQVQELSADFRKAKNVSSISMPLKGKSGGYVEGAFVYKHNKTGNLWLQYAQQVNPDNGETQNGYRIRQVKAQSKTNPRGQWIKHKENDKCAQPGLKGSVAQVFHYGTNHSSLVQNFKGKSYLFYHQVVADIPNIHRRVVYSPVTLRADGAVNPIAPIAMGKKWTKDELGKDDCAPPPTYKVGQNVQMELGKHDGMQKVNIPSGGKAVGYSFKGAKIEFPKFNFSGARMVEVRYATPNGGRLIVKAGGTVLKTLFLTSTGGWDSYKVVKVKLDKRVTGIKPLTLVMQNSSASVEPAKDYYNLDWMKFSR
jgi:hypothetical protein